MHKIGLSYLIVWFYAIVGGIGNGIMHPILSLRQGGYFPGLITSFASLGVGIKLINELVKARRIRYEVR